jgi:hypothetical protein
MKSKAIVFLIVFGMVFTVAMAAEVQNKGPEEIRLDGGKKGHIDFPHRNHQVTLGDCKICHDIFPQKPGIIKDLKNKGQLKKKQVMSHCRGCHRNMAKAGKKTGPTSCKKCHLKPA